MWIEWVSCPTSWWGSMAQQGEVGLGVGLVFVASRRVRLQSSLLMSGIVCPLMTFHLQNKHFLWPRLKNQHPEMQNSQCYNYSNLNLQRCQVPTPTSSRFLLNLLHARPQIESHSCDYRSCGFNYCAWLQEEDHPMHGATAPPSLLRPLR